MSCTLAANCGSFDSLKVRMRCGFRPCAAQIRWTPRRLIPVHHGQLDVHEDEVWLLGCGHRKPLRTVVSLDQLVANAVDEIAHCTPSGLVRQIGAIQEGRISGSS